MTKKMVVEKNQIGCHFQNGRRPKRAILKNAQISIKFDI
jgi:hypothetical protein